MSASVTPNPNSEDLRPVRLTTGVVLPTLIGGIVGVPGASAGAFYPPGTTLTVPTTTRDWLVANGWGVVP